MKAGRVETERNEARAMELEDDMSRAIQSWKDNSLKDELSEAEKREQRDDIKEGEHVRSRDRKSVV